MIALRMSKSRLIQNSATNAGIAAQILIQAFKHRAVATLKRQNYLQNFATRSGRMSPTCKMK